MKVKDLFIIKNGISSNEVTVYNEKKDHNYIPYIRPSNNQLGVIAGYVNFFEVDKKFIFDKETIYVSTDGQGSHSYSYVSSNLFVPNSNVCVLKPTINLNKKQKLFYALVITKNRYKFSYGRKPKKDKLKELFIPSPEEIPSYVNAIRFPEVPSKKLYQQKRISLQDRKWKWLLYRDIFEIKKGKRLTEHDQVNGSIPYVSSSSLNNGIDSYIGNGYTDENCITFACYGSIGEVFYQKEKVWVSDNANIFYLRNRILNPFTALFLVTLLKLEKYRFSYGMTGKKARLKNFKIKLPVDKNGNPDWQFMEDYIKSLPYSSNLK